MQQMERIFNIKVVQFVLVAMSKMLIYLQISAYKTTEKSLVKIRIGENGDINFGRSLHY